MPKKVEYRAFESANNLNEFFNAIINSEYSNELLTLAGKHSKKHGFVIYNDRSTNLLNFSFGSFMMARVITVNTNWSATASKISFLPNKGNFYFFQFYLAILIAGGIFFEEIKELVFYEKSLNYERYIIPLACIIYILLLQLWSIHAFHNLVNRIINILTSEGIDTEKL